MVKIKPSLSEARRLDPKHDGADLLRKVDALAAAVCPDHALEAWRLTTDALDLAGYLPGDVVLLDPVAVPIPRDVVAAQVSDLAGKPVEMIWRMYQHVGGPHPLATLNASSRKNSGMGVECYPSHLIYIGPLPVADERYVQIAREQRVKIVGVVVASSRPHPLSVSREWQEARNG